MKFIKVHEDAKLPERATINSAGYDFYVNETVTIPPNEVRILKTGVSFEGLPADSFIQLALRSSVSFKRPVMMANGVGIIDSDYAGHEIGVILYNRSNNIFVTIEKGERIAQGIILKYGKAEEKKVTAKRVGGTGSTGTKEIKKK